MATRLIQQSEPLPGYRLMERLGRGGYGEVWKAEAPGGLFKAIKFVYGDLEEAGEDNKGAAQELRALNRVKSIRHPFILSIERFDIIEGQLMIVMELADRNLWDRFQECRLQGLPGVPRDELLRYLDESSEALDLMNLQYQIQHLDIKPQNLFLVHNHVKVADFGLAKDLEGIRATITGGVTPVYAAPETFEGWISRFCDQYSLAIVYQELLTGVRPFSGMNTRQLLLQHLSAAPDLSSLPANERDVVARALAKKPDERFASCGEFVLALREASKVSVSPEVKPAPHQDTGKTQSNLKPSLADPAIEAEKKSDSPVGTPPVAIKNVRPIALKGLPALMTPGAVAASIAARPTPNVVAPPQTSTVPITVQRPIALDTGHLSKLGIAAPERMGSGVLFPVYLIGIGRSGLQVMQELRGQIQQRFGMKNFPHWKWLFIDTDPETVQAAGGSESGNNLEANEVYLARMHRPAHYTKQQGLPAPETWMTSQMLYRIPREPSTSGIRCLGRLALCDHFLSISQRIRQDLETFVTDDSLMEADRQTNLGIRSNRPRVYVASSLSGGTGSGMLIDLAYIIRNEMRQMGFLKPQLTGILLTPPLDRSTPKNLAAANTHSALSELNYFSQAANRFEARFDVRQATLADPDRPFERCVLLNLPRAASSSPPRAAERAAALIGQEALTALGARMDEARERYLKSKPPASVPLQSFGSYRISWPRQSLMETSAFRLAAMTVERWCAKDASKAREEISTWFEEEWRRRRLDPGSLANQIQAGLTQSLGDTADALIEAQIRAIPTDLSVKADLEEVAATLERVFKLVGKLGKEEESCPGQVQLLIDEATKPIARDCEVKFAKMAVRFIEQPGLRLAGAEETIRLATARLHLLIDAHDKVARALGEVIADEFRRLAPLLSTFSTARRGQAGTELVALLRSWCKKRVEFFQSRAITSIYRQMLGNAPGYVREVGVCRKQLGEFASALAKQTAVQSQSGSSRDHPIMIAGCKSLLEYAERIIDKIPLEELRHFEEEVQQGIRRQFRALLSVCGTLNEQGPRLQQLLVDQARTLLDARLGHHSSAQELFANRPDEQSIQREILRAYDECAPEPFGPVPRPDGQSFVLGVADDEHGNRLKQIVQELLPEVRIDAATSNDAVILYREYLDLAFGDLPQAGIHGADAVREIQGRQRIETHARTDVHWPN
jgi:serine/threonine protein kinase